MGSGKSSVARKLAAKFGYLYVDTGAMYRAVGVYAENRGVDVKNEEAICSLLPEIDIRLELVNGEQRTFLNGTDYSERIRTANAGLLASAVSKFAAVRAFLVAQQQNIAAGRDVVMDGRDIGTKVLPNAELKIFLDASPEVRAKRRFDELYAKGEPITFSRVLADVKKRDFDDTHRVESPLMVAPGAVVVDTSSLTEDGVADALAKMLSEVTSR